MKLLIRHLNNNRDALLKFSKLIAEAKHPVNIGTAREGLITNFLIQNLPDYIKYHSGEIFDSMDNHSGQVDIVLHPITSPKMNLHGAINIFPAETVLSAIEIKSTLTTGKKKCSFKDALDSCTKVKKLVLSKSKKENNNIVDSEKVPFILFAYKGPKIKTLKRYIKKHCDLFNKDGLAYRNLPDLIVVLDRGYYLMKRKNWKLATTNSDNIYHLNADESFVLLGIYELILKLVEYWFVNPQNHTMPIDKYTKEMKSLFELFEEQGIIEY